MFSPNSYYKTNVFTNHTYTPTTFSKPQYSFNARLRPGRINFSSGFCSRCKMLRPCLCSHSHHMPSFIPEVRYAQKSPQSPLRGINMKTLYTTSSSDVNGESGAGFDCDEDDSLIIKSNNSILKSSSSKNGAASSAFEGCEKVSKNCLKCNSSLSPPFCACGNSTYCDHCREITPCDRCPSTEDTSGLPKCSKCTCTLISPRCPCGRSMYCVQCEELKPCNCEQYQKQPKCGKCRNLLSPRFSACGHPTYCWYCEDHDTCQICCLSANSESSAAGSESDNEKHSSKHFKNVDTSSDDNSSDDDVENDKKSQSPCLSCKSNLASCHCKDHNTSHLCCSGANSKVAQRHSCEHHCARVDTSSDDSSSDDDDVENVINLSSPCIPCKPDLPVNMPCKRSLRKSHSTKSKRYTITCCSLEQLMKPGGVKKVIVKKVQNSKKRKPVRCCKC